MIAKSLTERGKEYHKLEDEIRAADKHQCHTDEVQLKNNYPKIFD
ncbi:hypothetical protein [Pontibacillus salipaludis]